MTQPKIKRIRNIQIFVNLYCLLLSIMLFHLNQYSIDYTKLNKEAIAFVILTSFLGYIVTLITTIIVTKFLIQTSNNLKQELYEKLSNNDNNVEKNILFKNSIKVIILTVLNSLLFVITFTSCISYSVYWINYSGAIMISALCMFFADFIIFDVIISLLLANSKSLFDNQSKFAMIFISLKEIRYS